MRARARSQKVELAIQVRSGVIAKRTIFLHFAKDVYSSEGCLLNTDIVVSDFEEHLKHGLGKNATNTDIWPMAVYCEEEDLKRNRRRGWLVPKNP